MSKDYDDLLEQLDDAYFEHMMHQDLEYEGKILLKKEKNIQNLRATPEQEKDFENLLKKSRKFPRTVYSSRHIRRVLLVVAAAIALLVSSLLSVQAIRIKIFNLLRIPGEIATEYRLSETRQTGYFLDYIPDDFEEVLYKDDNKRVRILLENTQNNVDFIDLYIYFDENRFSVDTENIDTYETIIINSAEAEIRVKDGTISIVGILPNSETPFYLQTSLSQEEAIKISENIFSK